MTEKQESYLLLLANRAGGRQARYLSQVRDILGLSSFEVARLTAAQASAIIDRLTSPAGVPPDTAHRGAGPGVSRRGIR